MFNFKCLIWMPLQIKITKMIKKWPYRMLIIGPSGLGKKVLHYLI